MSTFVIITVVLFLGALPIWLHSADWGYIPSGGIGLVLVVVGILTRIGWMGRSATEES